MRPVLGILGALGLMFASAAAHELRPAFLDLVEQESGQVELSWKMPIQPDRRLDLQLVLAPECPPVGAKSVQEQPTLRLEQRSLDCGPEGLAGRTISVLGLEATLIDAMVWVRLADGVEHTAILRAAQSSTTVPRAPRRATPARDDLALGARSMLGRPDHLLFVLGLLLLCSGAGQIVKAILAFTAAHSLALGLAVLGGVQASSGPVGAAMALGLLFVASELARGPAGRDSLAARSPWLAALGFGLPHGFEFAAVLAEAGIPEHGVPLALFQFNAGLELGQALAVLLFTGLRLGLRGRIPGLPPGLRLAAAYGLGSIAAYWCLTRIAAFW